MDEHQDRRGTDAAIASLCTDIGWIKDALVKMDGRFTSIEIRLQADAESRCKDCEPARDLVTLNAKVDIETAAIKKEIHDHVKSSRWSRSQILTLAGVLIALTFSTLTYVDTRASHKPVAAVSSATTTQSVGRP